MWRCTKIICYPPFDSTTDPKRTSTATVRDFGVTFFNYGTKIHREC